MELIFNFPVKDFVSQYTHYVRYVGQKDAVLRSWTKLVYLIGLEQKFDGIFDS